MKRNVILTAATGVMALAMAFGTAAPAFAAEDMVEPNPIVAAHPDTTMQPTKTVTAIGSKTFYKVDTSTGTVVYADRDDGSGDWVAVPSSYIDNSPYNTDNAHYGISAVGMTMVLITGGIDNSVASIASLTGMFIAYGNSILGIHPLWCILFALIVGVGLGLLQGAAIHCLKVPPFIATLTGNFLARGICSLISRESISIDHPMIDALAKWKIYFMRPENGEWVKIKPAAYINFNLLVFIIMIIIGTIILQKTRFGRNIYAVGGNEQSAKLMGLPVGRTKILVYGFNGLCSVLAGVCYALTVKSGWNLA